jgi:hypothetical protein
MLKLVLAGARRARQNDSAHSLRLAAAAFAIRALLRQEKKQTAVLAVYALFKWLVGKSIDVVIDDPDAANKVLTPQGVTVGQEDWWYGKGSKGGDENLGRGTHSHSPIYKNPNFRGCLA